MYANDDPVPWFNQPKNPYRPGMYITRSRVCQSSISTSRRPTASLPEQPRNIGNLNYWNHEYRDGYTNNGDLIGNTVGRMGRSHPVLVDVLDFSAKHFAV